MNSASQRPTDNQDQELSMHELSAVNGSGPIHLLEWIGVNALTFGVPVIADAVRGGQKTKRAFGTKC